MHPATATQPGILMRILHFAPVRLYLLYIILPYLYLAGYFYRQDFAKGPWEGLWATTLSGIAMLGMYGIVVHYCERRQVTELALPPAARELGEQTHLEGEVALDVETACAVGAGELADARAVERHAQAREVAITELGERSRQVDAETEAESVGCRRLLGSPVLGRARPDRGHRPGEGLARFLQL